MRKIVLLSILSLGTLPIYAQTSFGLLAGFNMATQCVRDNAPRVNSSFIPLWRAGIAADIHIADGFYLQPQLLVNAKGGKTTSHYNVPDVPIYTDFIQTKAVTNKVRALYLELPVNMLYKFTLCSGKVIAGAGPYAAIGLGGRVISDYRYNTGASIRGEESDLKFKNLKEPPRGNMFGTVYYKPLEAGFNFIAGYELNNGLALHINYSLGLTDVSSFDDSTVKNSYFGLTAGYFLRKRK
jgi:hypothetical protein